MKTTTLAIAAATAVLGLATTAAAEDMSVAYNIGVASDYVFRGISQTNKDPQIFGGADLTAGKAYAGVWASNVDFSAPGAPNGTSAEIDVYAGYKPTLGPVALDLGVIYYGYVDQPKGSKEGYPEFKVAGTIPAGKATLGAAVYYSPDFFGSVKTAWYYEGNGSVPLTDKLSASAAFGRQTVDTGVDYNTWNVGFTYAITEKVSFDVRYADTDKHKELAGLGDARAFATLKATF